MIDICQFPVFSFVPTVKNGITVLCFSKTKGQGVSGQRTFTSSSYSMPRWGKICFRAFFVCRIVSTYVAS